MALVRRWHVPALLALIVVGATLLRSREIAQRSFWFDEAFSWRLTRFPLVEMVERTAWDVHPPLYYLLLKPWAALGGTSPVALRSLSLVFSGLTVVGMYLFTAEAFAGREELGVGAAQKAKGLGLFVAGLVALSIFQARYGSEARMYALATALAAFSGWSLLRALRADSGRRRKWLVYGLLSLLFLYTHNYALFSLAAQAVFVVGFLCVQADWDAGAFLRGPTFRYALLTAAAVALGYLPWLPVLLRQRAQVQADYWTGPVSEWTVAHLCYQMFVTVDAPAPFSRRAALVAADLCALGLLALWRKARLGEWYLLSATVGPLGLSVLAFTFGAKVFAFRFFLFAHLFLVAGVGVLAARLPSWSGRWLAAVALVVASLYTYHTYWQQMDTAHKPGARGAAEFLAARRTPAEPVVVSSPYFYLPLRYHCGEQPGWYCYSDVPLRHYQGAPVLTSDDTITAERLAAVTARRVWVVNMTDSIWGDRAVPVPPGWVRREEERFPEVLGLGDMVVVAYETAAPPGGGRP